MTDLAIWVRNDAGRKVGGDLVLARHLEQSLLTAGIDARISLTIDELASSHPRWLHLFNIDRPFDIRAALGVTRGVPYSITALHHRRSWVQDFELHHRPGAHGLLAKAVRGFQTREGVKHAIRTRRPGALLAAIRREDLGRQILARARLVVCASSDEVTWIGDDFGEGSVGRALVVPNPVPRVRPAPRPWWARRYDVCVVGRIESRKNQVSIARALGSTGLSVVFVGDHSTGAKRYTSQFLREIDRSDAMVFLGRRPHDETLAVMADSRVSLSLSRFEVLSVADSEAFVQGCRVIASTRGSTASVLGAEVDVLDPDAGPDSIETAVRRALTLSSPGVEQGRDLAKRTDQAMDELVRAFEQLLGERAAVTT